MNKTQKQKSQKVWFLIRYGQSKQIFLFKIKCQAKTIFPSDVKRTVSNVTKKRCKKYMEHIKNKYLEI